MTTLARRSATDDATTAALGALGDSIRWSIVGLLADGERCVCDLESELDLAQSRLSYHLNILREAGLISARRDGRWAYYTLTPSAFEEVAGTLESLAVTARGTGEGALARCQGAFAEG